MQKFVNEYLTADHRRLDLIMDELRKANQENKPADYQQSLFHMFKSGLIRHIHWEETVLFPVFEEATGMTQGPTFVMRMEHSEMKQVLQAMEDELDAGIDPDRINALANCLDEHNVKEERILYPAIDQHLDSDRVRQVAINISREYK